MTSVRNISIGPRGIRTADGALVMLERGELRDLDLADGELDEDSEWFEFDAGEPVEDLKAMTVAELKAIAEAENVDLGDATRKADIVAAIELARGE